MTKEEYLLIAAERYDKFVALKDKDNFYDYEKEFVNILNDLGREVMEKNLGELSKDKRKKKRTLTTLGPVSINNSHPFCSGTNGFQISCRLQELLAYAGQLDSYQKANEIVKEFTAVEVSTTQLYRVTDYYGEQLNETVNQDRTLTPLRPEEVLYVQVDGSMLLTREQGWSEVKVGRYFKSSDCLHPGSKQGWIKASQYVTHLGNYKDFTAAMEPLIESYGQLGSRLVFISDGAVWIKNWITDAFPQAVSILDYYHVCEHLHDFSSQFFKDKEQEREWVKAQKTLLLEGGVATVIQQIEQLTVGNEQGQNLLAYYVANRERMDYQKYRQLGCGIIGSGAIESAHRTVVQRRMKQSGQRWSTKGAQHMLDLRVTKMNGQWAQVIHLAKYGKIASAA